jgi:hypothetical protein
MCPPPLLRLADEGAYRQHYENALVRGGPILTFDGLSVAFYPEQFRHAFFRDSSRTARDKARFDLQRAGRMDWIRAVLEDSSAEVYRRHMPDGTTRRIALWLQERYAVIVELRKGRPNQGRFITAYVVDSESALAKMRSNPRW